MSENIDANVKQEKNFDINLHGLRWTILALASLGIAISAVDTKQLIGEIKDIRAEQLKVQRAQLDVAKKQYTLDSLKFYSKER